MLTIHLDVQEPIYKFHKLYYRSPPGCAATVACWSALTYQTHLTRLITRENFIELLRRESLKSYISKKHTATTCRGSMMRCSVVVILQMMGTNFSKTLETTHKTTKCHN
ncbi:hypothetical protein L798_15808 [Zootermopsis nevadensis]|uniref:Uncharacterized protein n=1 Tax=Zootermopsis nevadensis TaxID=136037 RepID=A0A067QVD5_ZOONE|nr:hypothetical protein L798_15808 [Zootermopsis nevadensis]